MANRVLLDTKPIKLNRIGITTNDGYFGGIGGNIYSGIADVSNVTLTNMNTNHTNSSGSLFFTEVHWDQGLIADNILIENVTSNINGGAFAGILTHVGSDVTLNDINLKAININSDQSFPISGGIGFTGDRDISLTNSLFQDMNINASNSQSEIGAVVTAKNGSALMLLEGITLENVNLEVNNPGYDWETSSLVIGAMRHGTPNDTILRGITVNNSSLISHSNNIDNHE